MWLLPPLSRLFALFLCLLLPHTYVHVPSGTPFGIAMDIEIINNCQFQSFYRKLDGTLYTGEYQFIAERILIDRKENTRSSLNRKGGFFQIRERGADGFTIWTQIQSLLLAGGVLFDKILEPTALVSRQLLKLHTTSPHVCSKTWRALVGY